MTLLRHDHEGFESTVYECRRAWGTGDWERLQGLLEELDLAFAEHVKLEEEVIFLSYERHAAQSTQPTASLRADHAQIQRLIGYICRKVQQRKAADLDDDLALLYQVFALHHEKEEKFFLPMATALLARRNAPLPELLREWEHSAARPPAEQSQAARRCSLGG